MKKNFILLASLAVLFAACSDKEGDKKPADPTLEVTPAALQFSAEGETLTIKITTNQDWTVVENLDWIELSAGEGEACENLTVEVTAEANQTTEARNGSFTIKAGTLTKNVTLSQDFIPAPPPVVDNSTYELVSFVPLKYASDLVNGKFYAVHSAGFYNMCWTEAAGVLTMTENTGSEYSSSQVFEYVKDETGMNTTFDEYGNWSAGYWKVCSTGAYIGTDFNFTNSLDNALHVEYANNWGGTDAPNELNVFDVYVYPVTDEGPNNTIWYTQKPDVPTFHLATNGYQNEGNVPTTNRKWMVYEVAKVE